MIRTFLQPTAITTFEFLQICFIFNFPLNIFLDFKNCVILESLSLKIKNCTENKFWF